MGRTHSKAKRKTRRTVRSNSLVRVRWITHKSGRKIMIPLVTKSASKGRHPRKRRAKKRGDELDGEYVSHTVLKRCRDRESSVASEASTHTLG
jgi:ribosomal protein L28